MTPHQTLWDSLRTRTPLTVGAIADRAALQDEVFACDVVELRLDSLGTGEEIMAFAASCPLPLLITARGPIEGGQDTWSLEDRAAAYHKLLPYAAAIDIELRDFDALNAVISAAKKRNVVTVGSFHHFEHTPDLESLLSKQNFVADLHKFALMAKSSDCIQSQLSFMNKFPSEMISVMGMGPLGAAARPLMAKAGSLLNYGYLGATPTAPNQWPAGLLKKALAV